jgi:glycolate oxidase FAD binding subunit
LHRAQQSEPKSGALSRYPSSNINKVDKSSCIIDEFLPLSKNRPQSVAEISDSVRTAAASNQAVYPVGGGTTLDRGLPPKKPGVAVDLRALCQVIDYPARDMTITVQAGITLARLAEILRPENQRLPVDVPCAERATLGGALATNTSGSRRYGFGTFRDYVIGISVVNDEGHEIKAGGRVVKNVAGYDLCKLYVGSFGTLGIITQVTLKLRPLADEHALVFLGCESLALETLLDQIHSTRTRPVCLDLLNAGAARYIEERAATTLPRTAWVIALGFEGNRDAVGWQVQQLVKELPPADARGVDARIGPPAEPLWRALVELGSHPAARLTCKANLLPSATAALCSRADHATGMLVQAHAGNGIVQAHLLDDWTADSAAAMLKSWQETAASAQGNVVIQRCPRAWKDSLPIWGRPRGDAWLMREVKRQLDPRGLFNPGRFVDGI